jgi:lipopolysaccharide transport system permease protein
MKSDYLNNEIPMTIYSANDRRGGFIWAAKHAVTELWASRYVIWQLFLRDFTVQYRQKILGYVWTVLNPLIGVVSFFYLYLTGILKPGVEGMPYALYVLLGSNLWSVFSLTVLSTSGGLQSQSELVIRTNISKLALAVSSMGNLVFGMFVNLLVTTIIFFVYGELPTFWIFLYPLLALPLLIAGLSVGLILSVVNVIAKDLIVVVTQLMNLIMFITPVIYIHKNVTNPFLYKLITYNPFTYLISVPRSLIFFGSTDDTGIFLLLALGSALFLVFSLRVFYLISSLVAERL